MDVKSLFGFTVIPAAVFGASFAACLSRKVRDLFFVLLVFCSPLIERLDLNFVSREWYRGTMRGFEVSVLDVLFVALLVSSVLAPREGEKRAFWPASLAPMLFFVIYACGNVLANEPKLFGYFELSRMFRGILLVVAVAFYLRTERELRLLILALASLVCYEGLLALEQRYVEGLHRVPGTIDDSNSLSVFVCLTAPVLVAALNCRLPRYLKILCAAGIGLACVAEILTISRAGVIILGSMLLATTLATMTYRVTARKVVMCVLIPLAAGGMAAKSWKTFSARFDSSNLEQEYGNKHNMGRGYYIRLAKAIVADHPFGIGLNNWSYRVSNEYGPRLGYRFVPYRGVNKEPSDIIPPNSNVDEAQAAPAHCLAALTAGELGIPGLLLFGLVWLRWFQMAGSFLWNRTTDPMRRMGVGILFGFGGIFLQSITEWVFRQTPIYFVFHVLVGALASMYYVKKQEEKQAWAEQVEMEPELEAATS